MKAQVSSEFRKLTTTFGPWVALGMILVVSLGNTVLSASNGPTGFDQTGAALALPVIEADIWATSLAYFLGMLVTGTDHRYGGIVPTYLANPRRGRVLAAKLVTAACAGAAVAVLVFVLAVAIGFPILASQGADLGGIVADPLFWAQSGMAILSVTLVTAFGAAVAALLHSLVATIAIAVAVSVVEAMTVVVDYIPLRFPWTYTFSLQNMVRGIGDVSDQAWWVSALIVVGWLAAYVVAASVRVQRQEVT